MPVIDKKFEALLLTEKHSNMSKLDAEFLSTFQCISVFCSLSELVINASKSDSLIEEYHYKTFCDDRKSFRKVLSSAIRSSAGK